MAREWRTDWRCQFDSRAVREDTVVAGGVNRFRSHGGIGFTRVVRAWRAQATGVWDRGYGLACMVGRGDKGNLPLSRNRPNYKNKSTKNNHQSN
jgi:hypothetical protein